MKFINILPGLVLSTVATKLSIFSPLSFDNDSTDSLSTFQDVLNSCEAKFTAIVYQSSQTQSLEKKLNKESLNTKFNLDLDISASKLENEIKKGIKQCKAEIEDHEQDYSITEVNESPIVAKYYVDSKTDSMKFIKNIEDKYSRKYLIIVVNTPSQDSANKAHKTHTSTENPTSTEEPTEHPTHVPHKPYQDPFFWWVSAPIILSLLLSLFLISIVVVAISWLVALESPAFDKHSNPAKKTN